jgi:type II secretory ATPase GspE/PulE/Tfp pilus assembly ATPase PilB-like protein
MAGTARKTTPKSPKLTGQALVKKTWQQVLGDAIRVEASNIHIESGTGSSVVRYRRHGLLLAPVSLPPKQLQPLISYLKERAQLDLRQPLMPQAGTFVESYQRRDYQCSVAVMPLLGGERLVVHIKHDQALPPLLQELGLWGKGLQHVQHALTQPYGLILVSGPRHSGVSITLASFAAALAHPAHRIASVEAEVAYRVPAIEYMDVNPQIGMTWHRVLKLQLKHEPSAVVLGSMSDQATAKAAVAAAQHQQLLLCGIAVDTPVDSINQAARLAGDPISLAAVTRLVTNQRLVWHLCPHCRQAYVPQAKLQQQLNDTLHLDQDGVMKQLHELEMEAIKEGLSGSSDNEPSTNERSIVRLWRARPDGCEVCHGSGYSGAIALFNVLPISDNLRGQIAEQASRVTLQRTVSRERVISLELDGLIKALRGLIAIESVPGL